MMWELQFTAVVTFNGIGRLQGIMRAPLVATRTGNFPLWNCHNESLFKFDSDPAQF